MATDRRHNALRAFVENVGRHTYSGVQELGYVFALLVESLFWLLLGKTRNQPVRVSAVFGEAMQIGVQAVPIVSVLSFAVGVMLAIQGIYTLRTFGAESKVVLGVALAITREFAPLIVGVLVAGRSGSAITARIGTMHESQEIDALRVIGINPVRYLATPVLVAMLIVVPTLTVLGDLMGVLGGGLFTALELGMSLNAYIERTLDVLSVDDIRQGLVKSLVFAVIIALVGVSNGFQVGAGAEGVGRSTTRSVVLSISAIVLADMIFTYFLNR
ncbi:MAG: ABC transporter permease [Gammaproteobacteria bacterium]|nr:ABC transporter permease [Gammaproteobacteria bacterium]NIR98401.1 ABC transporter permease [Gammaproteobacteria bacterium]NIT64155.1 ABC transporter permease [Gammaproteobacteria bacterium]NIV21092.1 MlaE family lipid ABC transporter permease subunit [Gammaproteobacteria bacterium]NIY32735.1 MlaE family lipid ABC transporter permease subunit [Gammaproteobacteria bacterium]